MFIAFYRAKEDEAWHNSADFWCSISTLALFNLNFHAELKTNFTFFMTTTNSMTTQSVRWESLIEISAQLRKEENILAMKFIVEIRYGKCKPRIACGCGFADYATIVWE